jgi:hypothetical protein
MKTCPFCAEEIQDAAIVCKHCQRDLNAAPAVDRSTLSGRDLLASPRKKMGAGKIATIIVGLLVAFMVFSYFYTDHQEFTVWAAKRDAWHGRCEQFIGKPQSKAFPNAEQDQCIEDLTALMAEAKTHGWASVK